MSSINTKNFTLNLGESKKPEVLQTQLNNLKLPSVLKNLKNPETTKAQKIYNNSRSSDSGKSSSCSPVLLDCSFDSGIAGVLLDSNDMQLHKRIQQCQCILLALERDREYFFTIRNRLSKISDRKKKPSNDSEFFCNVCCADIDPEDDKTFVKCCICLKYICRGIKCADWLAKTSQWECELCQSSKESLAQTSSWVAEQITFHKEKMIHPPRARSEIYIPISECNDSSIHFESVSQIGANSAVITAEQKHKIREYVEDVVAKLLGGNLDMIAVTQLSKSENYLPDPKVDHGHNNGISRESLSVRAGGKDFAEISETRLRQMIQKIIAETVTLSSLSNGHAVSEISLDTRSKTNDSRLLNNGYYRRHRTEHYFEPTFYQDLLATAVLNKIVDKQLKNMHEVSESNISAIVDNEGNVINDNIILPESDQNLNLEKLSTTSGSSVEPRSDCSYPEMEQILNTNDDKSSELLRTSDRDSVMSDYLASHMIPLPDLNAVVTESEDDDLPLSVSSSAVGDGTWEKNWLFKKKRSTTLSGSVTANSAGMLVPDPKEDVRAQIGDKTTDEISDLSEFGSDTDDSLESLRSKMEPMNDRLINKHLIGGQNSKLVLDELIESSSMISNTTDYTDACNEHVIDMSNKNEAINNNFSHQAGVTEHIEHIGSVLLEDPNSNTLAANDDNSESVECTGFSSIEIIEPTSRTPSVIEILAAMALGPMIAVSSHDEPATLSAQDFSVFTDLKELALAEIKARSLELTPCNLDVIPEETCDHQISDEHQLESNFFETKITNKPSFLHDISESLSENEELTSTTEMVFETSEMSAIISDHQSLVFLEENQFDTNLLNLENTNVIDCPTSRSTKSVPHVNTVQESTEEASKFKFDEQTEISNDSSAISTDPIVVDTSQKELNELQSETNKIHIENYSTSPIQDIIDKFTPDISDCIINNDEIKENVDHLANNVTRQTEIVVEQQSSSNQLADKITSKQKLSDVELSDISASISTNTSSEHVDTSAQSASDQLQTVNDVKASNELKSEDPSENIVKATITKSTTDYSDKDSNSKNEINNEAAKESSNIALSLDSSSDIQSSNNNDRISKEQATKQQSESMNYEALSEHLEKNMNANIQEPPKELDENSLHLQASETILQQESSDLLQEPTTLSSETTSEQRSSTFPQETLTVSSETPVVLPKNRENAFEGSHELNCEQKSSDIQQPQIVTVSEEQPVITISDNIENILDILEPTTENEIGKEMSQSETNEINSIILADSSSLPLNIEVNPSNHYSQNNLKHLMSESGLQNDDKCKIQIEVDTGVANNIPSLEPKLITISEENKIISKDQPITESSDMSGKTEENASNEIDKQISEIQTGTPELSSDSKEEMHEYTSEQKVLKEKPEITKVDLSESQPEQTANEVLNESNFVKSQESFEIPLMVSEFLCTRTDCNEKIKYEENVEEQDLKINNKIISENQIEINKEPSKLSTDEFSNGMNNDLQFPETETDKTRNEQSFELSQENSTIIKENISDKHQEKITSETQIDQNLFTDISSEVPLTDNSVLKSIEVLPDCSEPKIQHQTIENSVNENLLNKEVMDLCLNKSPEIFNELSIQPEDNLALGDFEVPCLKTIVESKIKNSKSNLPTEQTQIEQLSDDVTMDSGKKEDLHLNSDSSIQIETDEITEIKEDILCSTKPFDTQLNVNVKPHENVAESISDSSSVNYIVDICNESKEEKILPDIKDPKETSCEETKNVLANLNHNLQSNIQKNNPEYVQLEVISDYSKSETSELGPQFQNDKNISDESSTSNEALQSILQQTNSKETFNENIVDYHYLESGSSDALCENLTEGQNKPEQPNEAQSKDILDIVNSEAISEDASSSKKNEPGQMNEHFKENEKATQQSPEVHPIDISEFERNDTSSENVIKDENTIEQSAEAQSPDISDSLALFGDVESSKQIETETTNENIAKDEETVKLPETHPANISESANCKDLLKDISSKEDKKETFDENILEESRKNATNKNSNDSHPDSSNSTNSEALSKNVESSKKIDKNITKDEETGGFTRAVEVMPENIAEDETTTLQSFKSQPTDISESGNSDTSSENVTKEQNTAEQSGETQSLVLDSVNREVLTEKTTQQSQKTQETYILESGNNKPTEQLGETQLPCISKDVELSKKIEIEPSNENIKNYKEIVELTESQSNNIPESVNNEVLRQDISSMENGTETIEENIEEYEKTTSQPDETPSKHISEFENIGALSENETKEQNTIDHSVEVHFQVSDYENSEILMKDVESSEQIELKSTSKNDIKDNETDVLPEIQTANIFKSENNEILPDDGSSQASRDAQLLDVLESENSNALSENKTNDNKLIEPSCDEQPHDILESINHETSQQIEIELSNENVTKNEETRELDETHLPNIPESVLSQNVSLKKNEAERNDEQIAEDGKTTQQSSETQPIDISEYGSSIALSQNVTTKQNTTDQSGEAQSLVSDSANSEILTKDVESSEKYKIEPTNENVKKLKEIVEFVESQSTNISESVHNEVLSQDISSTENETETIEVNIAEYGKTTFQQAETPPTDISESENIGALPEYETKEQNTSEQSGETQSRVLDSAISKTLSEDVEASKEIQMEPNIENITNNKETDELTETQSHNISEFVSNEVLWDDGSSKENRTEQIDKRIEVDGKVEGNSSAFSENVESSKQTEIKPSNENVTKDIETVEYVNNENLMQDILSKENETEIVDENIRQSCKSQPADISKSENSEVRKDQKAIKESREMQSLDISDSVNSDISVEEVESPKQIEIESSDVNITKHEETCEFTETPSPIFSEYVNKEALSQDFSSKKNETAIDENTTEDGKSNQQDTGELGETQSSNVLESVDKKDLSQEETIINVKATQPTDISESGNSDALSESVKKEQNTTEQSDKAELAKILSLNISESITNEDLYSHGSLKENRIEKIDENIEVDKKVTQKSCESQPINVSESENCNALSESERKDQTATKKSGKTETSDISDLLNNKTLSEYVESSIDENIAEDRIRTQQFEEARPNDISESGNSGALSENKTKEQNTTEQFGEAQFPIELEVSNENVTKDIEIDESTNIPESVNNEFLSHDVSLKQNDIETIDGNVVEDVITTQQSQETQRTDIPESENRKASSEDIESSYQTKVEPTNETITVETAELAKTQSSNISESINNEVFLKIVRNETATIVENVLGNETTTAQNSDISDSANCEALSKDIEITIITKEEETSEVAEAQSPNISESKTNEVLSSKENETVTIVENITGDRKTAQKSYETELTDISKSKDSHSFSENVREDQALIEQAQSQVTVASKECEVEYITEDIVKEEFLEIQSHDISKSVNNEVLSEDITTKQNAIETMDKNISEVEKTTQQSLETQSIEIVTKDKNTTEKSCEAQSPGMSESKEGDALIENITEDQALIEQAQSQDIAIFEECKGEQTTEIITKEELVEIQSFENISKYQNTIEQSGEAQSPGITESEEGNALNENVTENQAIIELAQTQDIAIPEECKVEPTPEIITEEELVEVQSHDIFKSVNKEVLSEDITFKENAKETMDENIAEVEKSTQQSLETQPIEIITKDQDTTEQLGEAQSPGISESEEGNSLNENVTEGQALIEQAQSQDIAISKECKVEPTTEIITKVELVQIQSHDISKSVNIEVLPDDIITKENATEIIDENIAEVKKTTQQSLEIQPIEILTKDQNTTEQSGEAQSPGITESEEGNALNKNVTENQAVIEQAQTQDIAISEECKVEPTTEIVTKKEFVEIQLHDISKSVNIEILSEDIITKENATEAMDENIAEVKKTTQQSLEIQPIEILTKDQNTTEQSGEAQSPGISESKEGDALNENVTQDQALIEQAQSHDIAISEECKVEPTTEIITKEELVQIQSYDISKSVNIKVLSDDKITKENATEIIEENIAEVKKTTQQSLKIQPIEILTKDQNTTEQSGEAQSPGILESEEGDALNENVTKDQALIELAQSQDIAIPEECKVEPTTEIITKVELVEIQSFENISKDQNTIEQSGEAQSPGITESEEGNALNKNVTENQAVIEQAQTQDIAISEECKVEPTTEIVTKKELVEIQLHDISKSVNIEILSEDIITKENATEAMDENIAEVKKTTQQSLEIQPIEILTKDQNTTEQSGEAQSPGILESEEGDALNENVTKDQALIELAQSQDIAIPEECKVEPTTEIVTKKELVEIQSHDISKSVNIEILSEDIIKKENATEAMDENIAEVKTTTQQSLETQPIEIVTKDQTTTEQSGEAQSPGMSESEEGDVLNENGTEDQALIEQAQSQDIAISEECKVEPTTEIITKEELVEIQSHDISKSVNNEVLSENIITKENATDTMDENIAEGKKNIYQSLETQPIEIVTKDQNTTEQSGEAQSLGISESEEGDALNVNVTEGQALIEQAQTQDIAISEECKVEPTTEIITKEELVQIQSHDISKSVNIEVLSDNKITKENATEIIDENIAEVKKTTQQSLEIQPIEILTKDQNTTEQSGEAQSPGNTESEEGIENQAVIELGQSQDIAIPEECKVEPTTKIVTKKELVEIQLHDISKSVNIEILSEDIITKENATEAMDENIAEVKKTTQQSLETQPIEIVTKDQTTAEQLGEAQSPGISESKEGDALNENVTQDQALIEPAQSQYIAILEECKVEPTTEIITKEELVEIQSHDISKSVNIEILSEDIITKENATEAMDENIAEVKKTTQQSLETQPIEIVTKDQTTAEQLGEPQSPGILESEEGDALNENVTENQVLIDLAQSQGIAISEECKVEPTTEIITEEKLVEVQSHDISKSVNNEVFSEDITLKENAKETMDENIAEVEKTTQQSLETHPIEIVTKYQNATEQSGEAQSPGILESEESNALNDNVTENQALVEQAQSQNIPISEECKNEQTPENITKEELVKVQSHDISKSVNNEVFSEDITLKENAKETMDENIAEVEETTQQSLETQPTEIITKNQNTTEQSGDARSDSVNSEALSEIVKSSNQIEIEPNTKNILDIAASEECEVEQTQDNITKNELVEIQSHVNNKISSEDVTLKENAIEAINENIAEDEKTTQQFLETQPIEIVTNDQKKKEHLCEAQCPGILDLAYSEVVSEDVKSSNQTEIEPTIDNVTKEETAELVEMQFKSINKETLSVNVSSKTENIAESGKTVLKSEIQRIDISENETKDQRELQSPNISESVDNEVLSDDASSKEKEAETIDGNNTEYRKTTQQFCKTQSADISESKNSDALSENIKKDQKTIKQSTEAHNIEPSNQTLELSEIQSFNNEVLSEDVSSKENKVETIKENIALDTETTQQCSEVQSTDISEPGSNEDLPGNVTKDEQTFEQVSLDIETTNESNTKAETANISESVNNEVFLVDVLSKEGEANPIDISESEKNGVLFEDVRNGQDILDSINSEVPLSEDVVSSKEIEKDPINENDTKDVKPRKFTESVNCETLSEDISSLQENETETIYKKIIELPIDISEAEKNEKQITEAHPEIGIELTNEKIIENEKPTEQLAQSSDSICNENLSEIEPLSNATTICEKQTDQLDEAQSPDISETSNKEIFSISSSKQTEKEDEEFIEQSAETRPSDSSGSLNKESTSENNSDSVNSDAHRDSVALSKQSEIEPRKEETVEEIKITEELTEAESSDISDSVHNDAFSEEVSQSKLTEINRIAKDEKTTLNEPDGVALFKQTELEPIKENTIKEHLDISIKKDIIENEKPSEQSIETQSQTEDEKTTEQSTDILDSASKETLSEENITKDEPQSSDYADSEIKEAVSEDISDSISDNVSSKPTERESTNENLTEDEKTSGKSNEAQSLDISDVVNSSSKPLSEDETLPQPQIKPNNEDQHLEQEISITDKTSQDILNTTITIIETNLDTENENNSKVDVEQKNSNNLNDQQVLLDYSSKETLQYNDVKIDEDQGKREEDNDTKIIECLVSPSGKHNISKKLQRQYRVVDTTPSFEDVSPQLMPQSPPPSTTSSLAGLCQKFIHDKHLLTALENRRRQTLLMHRFLSTHDSSFSPDDSNEDSNKVHEEVLVTENPVVCESSNLSRDHDSDHDDCSCSSFILKINDPDKISYNFINNILFSDQISYETKPNCVSRTSTIEELYLDYDNNDVQDILTTNTCPITTNNSSTEINSKAKTTNPTKTNNHKHHLTYKSDNMERSTTTTNQNHRNIPILTSAVQNKQMSSYSRTTRRSHTRKSRRVQESMYSQIKIEILKDENDINNTDDIAAVGDGYHNDGVNKDHADDEEIEESDDGDDVAILRHFVPGSIAEREYKKWYNAVEMPNNPYAPEALKRRISGSQERFIDLPNISPTNDLNPLELLSNQQKLDTDETMKRECDYKRYSRDYYINSSSTTPHMSPSKDVSSSITKDNREPTKKATSSSSSQEKETVLDMYKAVPAHVVENLTTSSLISIELEPSEDSDTMKTQQETSNNTVIIRSSTATHGKEEANGDQARPSSLILGRSECGGNGNATTTPSRGSTPMAFKFLQPKRKLLEPNQVLSIDEDEPNIASGSSEKPVIEAEVVKSLPSVKALARAFLLTTSKSTQPEKLWLRKARTLSQGAKNRAYSPKRSLDHLMRTELLKPEDDVTITSDLSSLETDSSSLGAELTTASEFTTPPTSSTNEPSIPTDDGPLRQGVLKNNIAFFENLKNK